MIWLIPLESNPEIMTKFLHKLGVHPSVEVIDVISLEEDMLGFVPQPVGALLLLFPSDEEYKKHCMKQEEEIKTSGQFVSKDVFFAKQMVRNACGTIALIHGLANMDQSIIQDGPLKKYLEDARPLDPDGRGHLLETCEEIINAHKEVALEGQTEPPDEHAPTPFHYVCFVEKDNNLYELDGCKSFPINHGSSSPDTFLQDAAKACLNYIKRNPNNLNFTICAVTM